jgi:hypothetical protein
MDCDAREKRLWRTWILAIAILHWIVFALLVRNSQTADPAPPPARSLAEAVINLITGA